MKLGDAVHDAFEALIYNKETKEKVEGGTSWFLLKPKTLKTLIDAAKTHNPSLKYIGLTLRQLSRMPCADPGDGGCIGGLCPPCEARKAAKEMRSTR